MIFRNGKRSFNQNRSNNCNQNSKIYHSDVKRYVECRLGVGGLANKMFGLVSSFVIASLLNATLICITFILFLYLVPYNESLSIFTIKDITNRMILYDRPNNLPEPKEYTLYNSCYGEKPFLVQQLINNPVYNVFNDSYIVIQTNCPLFNWLTYNRDNYYSLIQLGILKNVSFESSHPAIHGFNVLSNIMKKHIVFNREFRNAVKDRRQIIGHSKCISMHIRMGNYKSDFHDGRIFLFDNDIMSFIDCPIIKKYPKAPIYLTSDSRYAKNLIVNNTHDHRVVSSSKKVIHTSHVSFANNFMGAYSTFLDLVTLGSCSEFVGTSGSTFTILAASLMGKLPYLVGKNTSCELPKAYFYY